MKTHVLFDHDGVLVDAEPWLGTGAQARAAGVDELTAIVRG